MVSESGARQPMRKGAGNAGPTEGRKSPARCAGLSRTGFALTSPYSIPGDDALRLGLHGTNGQRERAKAAEAQCRPCFIPRELAILGSAHSQCGANCTQCGAHDAADDYLAGTAATRRGLVDLGWRCGWVVRPRRIGGSGSDSCGSDEYRRGNDSVFHDAPHMTQRVTVSGSRRVTGPASPVRRGGWW
jgi:hypothetical protein